MTPITITLGNSSRCRRMIIIAQIKKLRKVENFRPVDSKIYREMRKLHTLWFKGDDPEEIRA